VLLIVGIGVVGLVLLNNDRQRRPPPNPSETGTGSETPLPGAARLQAISGPVTGFAAVLNPAGSMIGRSSACDFVLPDMSVSRQHARIVYANGAWFVQDAGSKTGTYLNGVQIGAARLTAGDRLRVGNSEILFVG
jgi:hypothetical protein